MQSQLYDLPVSHTSDYDCRNATICVILCFATYQENRLGLECVDVIAHIIGEKERAEGERKGKKAVAVC